MPDQDPPQIPPASQLAAARIYAIDAYGAIELALSILVSTLLGVDVRDGAAIVMRMTNTRSRYALISDLLQKPAFAPWRPFWVGLEKMLKPLDATRNNVVHWMAVVNLDSPADASLRSVKSFLGGQGGLSVGEIAAFAQDCERMNTLITLYEQFLRKPHPAGAYESIFRSKADDQSLKALLRILAES